MAVDIWAQLWYAGPSTHHIWRSTVHILTQEQADEVVRILGLDGQVEDYNVIGSDTYPAHLYFLEDGTCLQIAGDCQIEHQELVEQGGNLEPVDMQDIAAKGVDYGVVELIRNGKTMGLLDLFSTEQATPEERNLHDLRILNVTERAMRDGN